MGDGDPGVLNLAGAFAQRLDVLLGRLIRIDPRRGDPYAVPTDNPFVDVPDARPEIWAYGLRNPWRFWIDPETDVLYVPDVGSTSREEINVVAAAAAARTSAGRASRERSSSTPRAMCKQAPSRPSLSTPARTERARSSAASSCATGASRRSSVDTSTATSVGAE